MKLSSFLFLFLSLLGFTLANSLNAAPVIYENQLIERVEIQIGGGLFSEYQESLARSRMKTKEGALFSQADFDKDLKALSIDFDRIEPIISSCEGRLSIILHLWPKPRIRTITIQGNCKVRESDLRKELAISCGSIFDRQTFNKAFNKLKLYYIQQGYYESELSYSASYIESCNEVDVTVFIEEGRSGRVSEINFRCFTSDEIDEVTDLMITKRHNLFSFFTGEGTFHEEAIQQDKLVILNYLQNKGYADAAVDINVFEPACGGRIVVDITADKGPRYTFGEITLEGNTLFCDEEIFSLLAFRQGSTYSPESLRISMERLTNLYGKKGYIDNYVNFLTKLEEDCEVYSIHITIDEGEKYRVGLIKVFGNCSTQTSVILHETLLVPGEIFNLERLAKTEQRLRNIGYFKNVNVYAVRSEDFDSCLGDNYRDVHIEVEEMSTGHFGAFFGFSTVENFFGGFNLTERNFNSGGFYNYKYDGMRAFRGGGEFVNFTAMFGIKSTSYKLSFVKPHFMDTNWSVGCDFEKSYTRYISNDYSIQAAGYNLHAFYDLNAFMRTGFHYRIRKSDVNVNGCVPPSLKKQADHAGLISAVGGTLIYDSTDSSLRPTNGTKSRLLGEFAGVGGDVQFLNVGYLNTYYWQVNKRGVLKIRFDFRFIQPVFETDFGHVPLDERIFLGGDNEIRGYRPFRLGEKYTDKDGKESDDPEGGISMQLFSYEYQHRIFSRLDAFVFCDAGFLSTDTWAFGVPWTSVGCGIRVQVFESGPPLMVGFGYPINPRDDTDIKRFFFNIGGKF